ncbi:MAG: hypothetical protein Q7S65_00160 [Nanoarchaeota archaeon]|nr:hypothetical protein [Nanoarchaeota archaeon]
MDEKSAIKKDVPAGVKTVSVMYFILGAFGLIPLGVVLLIGAFVNSMVSASFILVAIIFLVLVVLDISVGVGLWKGKPWARTTALTFSGLGLIGMIIGIVQMIQGNNAFALMPSKISFFASSSLLIISGLYLLLNKNVKKAFA